MDDLRGSLQVSQEGLSKLEAARLQAEEARGEAQRETQLIAKQMKARWGQAGGMPYVASRSTGMCKGLSCVRDR